MREAILGGLLGLVGGGLSVFSLWLITGFAAQAARGLGAPPEKAERPSGWDAEAQDPDRVTSGQWWRREEEAAPETTRESSGPGSIKGATLRVSFAFLLKVPILIAIALVARSLGSEGLYWCVGGVMLVYFLAVFWAAARTDRR